MRVVGARVPRATPMSAIRITVTVSTHAARTSYHSRSGSRVDVIAS